MTPREADRRLRLLESAVLALTPTPSFQPPISSAGRPP